MSYGGGFSILAWVKKDSPIIAGLTFDTKDELEKELLNDAITLWSVRWGIDMGMVTIDHHLYIYGSTLRFTASNNTIRDAIGDLSEHIEFYRGTPVNTAEDLVRYQKCRKKWKVPDRSENSSGWGDSAQAETSQFSKRKKYS